MAEFDFPSTNLTDGDTHTQFGITFVWDATNGAWKKNSAPLLKGEEGDKGEQGDKGIQGDKGLPGEEALKGDQGDKGIQGDDGDKGIVGDKGLPGEEALKGESGDKGIQGDKGEQGDKGISGSDAEKGEKGQPSGGFFEILPTHVVNPSNNTTEVEFTGIPAETYEITLMFAGVSATGNDNFKIQLGTASAYIATNYYSLAQNEAGEDEAEATDCFIIRSESGNRQRFGSMVIRKASNAHYVQTGQFAVSPTQGGNQTYGSLTSGSATVTRLRVILSGTNTFDAGSISLSYKTDGGGDKGEKGVQGDKGLPGEDALKGEQGDKGISGAEADKGEQGDKGIQGDKGLPGEEALKGEQGDKGIQGDKGVSGSDAEKGEPGGAGSSVPSGGIILWSGAANLIGSSSTGGTGTGWVLCDGQNGTPDLRNRFVVGAGDYNSNNYPNLKPNATPGGSANATLVSHSHSISLTTGNDTHSHSYNSANHPTSSGPEQNQSGGPEDRTLFNQGKTTGNDTHSHSVSGNTGTQGSSATNANLPPYYALCYIMKT